MKHLRRKPAVYRKATTQEHLDFINYGTPRIVVRAVVTVGLCEHGNAYPHLVFLAPHDMPGVKHERCKGADLEDEA